MLHGVLIGLVLGHLSWQLCDNLAYLVFVSPNNIAKTHIEFLNDVAQLHYFRFTYISSLPYWYSIDFCICIFQ